MAWYQAIWARNKSKKYTDEKVSHVGGDIIQDPDDPEGGIVTPGTSAGFGTPTIAVDDGIGTPYAEVTATGLDTAKEFHFSFHNLKGKDGNYTKPETGIPESDLSADIQNKLNKPYLSIVRRDQYLFDVTYDTLVPDNGTDIPVGGACSSYVQDGELFTNLDWNYDECATFHITGPGFDGTAFMSGLTATDLNDELIGQLPYHIRDGANEYGIKVATHVLFNDWEATGDGAIPLTKLPYLVLTNVKSMATLEDDLDGILDDLYIPAAMAAEEYLIQVMVTDGTTTYVLRPSTDGTVVYEAVDATDNPKLTNFLWVADATVDRADLQTRPTGVERWNMMPAELSELRFTKAYETPDRLSEFIGIDGTDKDSTDEELTAIYDLAHAAYLTRTRDGSLWQTMHGVVYGANGLTHLWIQENWENDFIATAGGGTAESTEYDNTVSGLEATNVQDALDELAGREAGVSSVNGQTGEVVLTQDNITDGATYKRVTTAEKNTWNGKQAALGFTPENAANKVNAIDANSDIGHYPSAKAVYDSFGNIFTVYTSASDDTLGTVTAGGVFPRGSQIELTATPETGASFIKWVDARDNSLISNTATFTYTVQKNIQLKAVFYEGEISIANWATSTDAEIIAFLQLADAGVIDLDDHWSIGDTRTVHLSATAADTPAGIEAHAEQDVELVLMDNVCTGFEITATGSKPHFIVGLKNGLLENGQMNSSGTNAGGWRDCKRRSWCNNQFKSSIPSTLLPIFKQFTWSQGQGGGQSSGLITTSDYFALAPEQAIFGKRSYSFADEAALYTQWDYYKTAANRIKKSGAAGSASYWWESSPYSGNSGYFCGVYSNGTACDYGASSSNLLAPFGCL